MVRLLTFQRVIASLSLIVLTSCSVGGLGDVTDIFFPGINSDTGNTAIAFSPSVHDFGYVAAGTGSASQTFTITNNTGVSVYIASLGGASTDFSITSDTCPRSPTAFAASASCQASITFAPATSGAKSMSLIVTYGIIAGDTSLAATVGMSGTAVASISFSGVDSLTGVTSTTVNVNWTHAAGAVRYFIYTVDGAGALTYAADVNAPIGTKTVTGLTPGTNYTFRVRAMDVLGLWDGNTHNLSTTTLNPGTFTAIATQTAAEGATTLSAVLSCTNQYGDTPVYSIFSQTDTDSNCSISAAPERISCIPNYKTGHSAWSSTVVARCVINGQTLSNSFLVNVADTNRAPDMPAVADQRTQITNAITAVDLADVATANDTDADTDALLYSCTFSKDGGATTACSSAALTGTFSLNTATGVVNWTPGAGAITGETNSSFFFTLTASDQRPAPLTDTATFTVLVSPINPVLTSAGNYTISAGTHLKLNDVMTLDFDNIRDGTPGNDTNMSYTCVFDKHMDGDVIGGTACTELSQFSFSTTAGTVSWTVDYDAMGTYEFKITGTDSSTTFSGSRVFVADVRASYSLTNILRDWDAQFANLTNVPATSYGFWRDILGTTDISLPAFISGGGWFGAGTPANPDHLLIDGSTGVLVGQALNGQTNFGFQTWMLSSSPTTASRAVLSNGGGTGNGFLLRQASDASGKLEMVVGPDYTSYSALVLADNPVGYWRLGEAAGVTAADSSGANSCAGTPCNGTYTGGYTLGTAGSISGDADTQVTFDGATGYIALPQTLNFAGDYTIEAWATAGAAQGVLVGTANIRDDALGGATVGAPMRMATCVTPGTFASCTTTSGVNNIATGVLHHYVVVRSGTDLTMYMDGELYAFTSGISDTLQVSRIGMGSAYNAASLRYWNGTIDEVALYNTAFSQQKARSHYNAGMGALRCRSSTTFDSSRWKHVVGTYNATTGLASMYVNGRQDCSYYTRNTYSSATDLYAGSSPTGTNLWTGKLADLRLYAPSSATAVKSGFNYTANRFRPSPMPSHYESSLLFKLDAANALDRVNPQTSGGCGTGTWKEQGPTPYDATLTNFNCTASSGWNGTGTTSDPYRLTFDGVDDYVNGIVTSVNWLMDNAPTAHSAEIWAYLSASAGDRPLFNMGNSSGSGRAFELIALAGSNAWRAIPNGPQTPFTFDGHNRWVHYAMTTDGSNARVYANGEVVATGTTSVILSNTEPLVLGRSDANYGVFYFQGDIAYFAFYDRELSPAEVSTLCNFTKGRFSGVAGGVTCH